MAEEPKTSGKRHPQKALTPAKVRSLADPGRYADGNGLYLLVKPGGAKSWVQRLLIHGRRQDIGLGGVSVVTLAEAREKAQENKRLVLAGGDPLAEKHKDKETLFFAQAMERYLDKQSKESRNAKHFAQWRSTLTTYALPILGKRTVQAITHQDVLRVLEPIWETKTETASRLRGRIEAVLSWATVAGYRKGDNPARWGGNLAELLPKPSKVAKGDKQPAVALADLPRWWGDLVQREGIAAQALQFLALTTSRSGEVRGMTWGEVVIEGSDTTDTTDKTPAAIPAIPANPNWLWVIPANRMKAGREHRVPLTKAAVAILRAASGAFEGEDWQKPEAGALVFAAPRGGMLSDMSISAVMRRMQEAEVKAGRDGWLDPRSRRPAVPHGLRSTFRDWAAERGFDRDMAEMALAHEVGSAVERAYRRSDMLERRRAMAEAWAQYVQGEDRGAQVVAMRRSN